MSHPPTPPESSPSTPPRNDVVAEDNLSGGMLVEIRDSLATIAQRAGKMMVEADPSVCTSATKNNTSDRVTETDKAVENMVKESLTTAYPAFAFLGEESSKANEKLTDAPTFICDPIDGTLNFIHGFPNTAVSLAFAVDKKPVVGVVFNPFRGDLFSGVKGQGAQLFNIPTGTTRSLPISKDLMHTRPMTSLNECLVAVEWGNQREGPNWELRTSMSQQLMSAKRAGGAMVHSIRSSGSAALDFCYVAAGWIDVFWEGGCYSWDVAAGWIILEEAGGMVASANPGDWDPELEGRLYLAVRGAKEEEQRGVVEELWGMMGERRFVYEKK